MPYVTSFDGAKINYEIVGKGKRPIFFIMGLGMDKRGWMFQVPYFADDFLIFLVDNRGVGKSDVPEGFFTTSDMAQDIYEIMKKEGIEKADMVGISLGGMILQKFASKYKDMVQKLVLACTLHKLDDHENQLIKNGMKFVKGLDLDKVDESVLRKHMEYLLDTDPQILLKFLLQNLFSQDFLDKNIEFLLNFFDEYIKNFSIKGFLKQLLAVVEHDSTEDLKEIKANTLVITGDADKMVPPWKSEFIAKNISSAKLKIIKGGSHALNLENYEEFNREVKNFIYQN